MDYDTHCDDDPRDIGGPLACPACCGGEDALCRACARECAECASCGELVRRPAPVAWACGCEDEALLCPSCAEVQRRTECDVCWMAGGRHE